MRHYPPPPHMFPPHSYFLLLFLVTERFGNLASSACVWFIGVRTLSLPPPVRIAPTFDLFPQNLGFYYQYFTPEALFFFQPLLPRSWIVPLRRQQTQPLFLLFPVGFLFTDSLLSVLHLFDPCALVKFSFSLLLDLVLFLKPQPLSFVPFSPL